MSIKVGYMAPLFTEVNSNKC